MIFNVKYKEQELTSVNQSHTNQLKLKNRSKLIFKEIFFLAIHNVIAITIILLLTLISNQANCLN